MKKRLLLVLLLISAALVVPAPTNAIPSGTKVQLYEGGLNTPIDMAWVRGRYRVFVTEKSGAIRIVAGGRLLTRSCVRLPVNDNGESGALGIALHPGFKTNHQLYVFYTNASPYENRVSRFVVEDNRCTRKRNIVTGLAPPSRYHNGGQLEFVGGKLFVSTGEAHDPSLAQNKRSRLGKILQVNPDGSVPRDNPFGNAVWSYGHRNPFGLTHEPGTRRVYSTENGPQCDDELNRIVKGRNYGWGDGYRCGTRGVGTNPKPPIRRWRSIIVPTDPWWYRGRMKRLSGSLYVGDYMEGRLHRIVMNDRGTRVLRDRIIFDSRGRIVDVSKGPGGWLYFLTLGGGMYRIVPR